MLNCSQIQSSKHGAVQMQCLFCRADNLTEKLLLFEMFTIAFVVGISPFVNTATVGQQDISI